MGSCEGVRNWGWVAPHFGLQGRGIGLDVRVHMYCAAIVLHAVLVVGCYLRTFSIIFNNVRPTYLIVHTVYQSFCKILAI